MKKRLRKGQVPPRRGSGSWHYFQPGYEKPINGHSRANMIDEIGKFRLANGLEFGDPEKDLEDYICTNWPRTCTEDYSDRTPEDDLKELVETTNRTNLESIRLESKLFAHSKSTRWETIISAAEAEERAKTCAACPSNRAFSTLTGCHGCVVDLTRMHTILVEGKKVKPKTGWCSSVLADTRSMQFIPKEGLERQIERAAQDAPGECWLRKLKS